MPTRRQWAAGAVVVPLLSTLCLAFVHQGGRQCTVTADSYDKIVDGMTEEQVETLLGGPAGDYSTTRAQMMMLSAGFCAMRSDWTLKTWVGNDCAIDVGFSEDGTVQTKRLCPIYRRTLVQRLLDWLGF
jgi:hypothetical protein